ncbi:MAG: hypothetical protein KDB22_20895 [Planctomycetales bacterium]|nr:hypothetical protein [Planctomycetales bacterium]
MFNNRVCREVRMSRPASRRRGAALILAVALMFVLFSVLAFSIDTGYLSQARAEIRRTADAAAMAGCWELYSQMDQGVEGDESYQSVRSAASAMAGMNPVCRVNPTVDDSETTQEIAIGFLGDLSGTISTDDSLPYYAVQVDIHKTPDHDGQVPYFFGRIFGDTGRSMDSSATAVFARRISGFKTPDEYSTLDVLPFALDVDTWNNMMDGTTMDDDFSYESGGVVSGSDGIYEVNLYPQGTGSPGNRGTVDIGGANNSTNDIARQIVDGISKGDLEDLGKPLSLEGGLTLNGDTGISAGVKDELASIIGQKRIIPLFSSVSGNGNNANYTIVRWVGVRILDVKLTGKMSGKKLIVQPAPVLARNAIVSTSSESSDYVLSPVYLAR